MATQPPRPEPTPSTPLPRWVKVSAIIAGILLVLVAIMLITGHDPGRHMGSAGTGGGAPLDRAGAAGPVLP